MLNRAMSIHGIEVSRDPSVFSLVSINFGNTPQSLVDEQLKEIEKDLTNLQCNCVVIKGTITTAIEFTNDNSAVPIITIPIFKMPTEKATKYTEDIRKRLSDKGLVDFIIIAERDD